MNATQPTPLHHHLVAAQLVFQTTPDAPFQQVILNTTIRTANDYVTAADLARAQQGVQMQLHQQLSEPAIVTNVIIMSVSHLGLMTDEQFISELDRMREQAASGQPN